MSSGPRHSYYQFGNRMWFKTAQNRCTTKFGKGRVTKVISPQSVLVDGVPRHVKDLHTQHSLTLLEEDSDGTPSESEAESLLCDTEDTESDDSPEEGAVVEPPPVPLRRSTRQKWLPPDCQAVKNMFTSEGRTYSESREKKHIVHVNFYMPEFA